jgi:uroporphyrin-III C-methyltransferase/precorrin-2 dehydrogenase/sirohydrochlorin ferrochelatase
MASYPDYHPVFLDLNGKPVLIVGGGFVALEKLNSLLPRSGANITVLAPWIRDEVREMWQQGQIRWIEKRFDPSDLDPYFMIIAATNDPDVNHWVFREGNARLRLTNSVDDPVNCNFIMAAMTGHGPMQVAVSSAGTSPALAQRVRNRIAKEVVTPTVGLLATYLGSWRPVVKKALPNYRARQAFWEAVIDSDVPEALEANPREADRRLRRVLKEFVLRAKAGERWEAGT